MTLITYQSQAVLSVLKAKKIYYAKPSITYKKEYGALIEMLKMDCQCPVFAVVKGRKQNTSGRVSGTVKMVLEVPDEEVKFTEFSVWADFLYASQFTRPTDYRRLKAGCEEVTVKKFEAILNDLKTPRLLSAYKFPQALIERIEPHWLVNYKIVSNKIGTTDFSEKIFNMFRR